MGRKHAICRQTRERIVADLAEITQLRKEWSEICKVMKEKKIALKDLYGRPWIKLPRTYSNFINCLNNAFIVYLFQDSMQNLSLI